MDGKETLTLALC